MKFFIILLVLSFFMVSCQQSKQVKSAYADALTKEKSLQPINGLKELIGGEFSVLASGGRAKMKLSPHCPLHDLGHSTYIFSCMNFAQISELSKMNQMKFEELQLSFLFENPKFKLAYMELYLYSPVKKTLELIGEQEIRADKNIVSLLPKEHSFEENSYLVVSVKEYEWIGGNGDLNSWKNKELPDMKLFQEKWEKNEGQAQRGQLVLSNSERVADLKVGEILTLKLSGIKKINEFSIVSRNVDFEGERSGDSHRPDEMFRDDCAIQERVLLPLEKRINFNNEITNGHLRVVVGENEFNLYQLLNSGVASLSSDGNELFLKIVVDENIAKNGVHFSLLPYSLVSQIVGHVNYGDCQGYMDELRFFRFVNYNAETELKSSRTEEIYNVEFIKKGYTL